MYYGAARQTFICVRRHAQICEFGNVRLALRVLDTRPIPKLILARNPPPRLQKAFPRPTDRVMWSYRDARSFEDPWRSSDPRNTVDEEYSAGCQVSSIKTRREYPANIWLTMLKSWLSHSNASFQCHGTSFVDEIFLARTRREGRNNYGNNIVDHSGTAACRRIADLAI
jgi:hypothetical protein